jgi:hypothetical protein
MSFMLHVVEIFRNSLLVNIHLLIVSCVIHPQWYRVINGKLFSNFNLCPVHKNYADCSYLYIMKNWYDINFDAPDAHFNYVYSSRKNRKSEEKKIVKTVSEPKKNPQILCHEIEPNLYKQMFHIFFLILKCYGNCWFTTCYRIRQILNGKNNAHIPQQYRHKNSNQNLLQIITMTIIVNNSL